MLRGSKKNNKKVDNYRIRRVKDPAGLGRVCYQAGFDGRVFCGDDAEQRAINDARMRIAIRKSES